MAERRITITIPDETYHPFQRRAAEEQRSVEEAIVAAMESSIHQVRDNFGAWHGTFDALAWLDTASLWQIIERGAETEDVLLLRAIAARRQDAGATPTDIATEQALVEQHDRAILIRAHALALLHQRGEDTGQIVHGQ